MLEHGKFIMGPEVGELERNLAAFVGATHCVSCSNGTDALLLSLMAHGVEPGDAIFATPFTFIATAEVVCLLGVIPLFVDIDPQTYNIDPGKLELRIVKIKQGQDPLQGRQNNLKLKGIIAVDLFGLPADYDAINRIASQHDLFVLEDAAQSLGGIYNGRRVGNVTDIAATSFFPAKPLGSYGDKGAIFTNDEVIANTLRSLREHGKGSHKYDNVRIGINGQLDTLQAAILLAQLEVFEREIKKRQEIAERYSSALKKSVQIPFIPDGLASAWAQYSVVTDHRDVYLNALKKEGIPTAIYYPRPLHMQTAFAHLGYREGDFPVAERMSEHIFSLPMHSYLTPQDQEKIVAAIENAHAEM